MMASDGQNMQELKCEKPYVGLQRGIQVIGCIRDTNYLGTHPNFMLREGTDEFVIVYYFSAIDFRTGSVVWERPLGTGFGYDSFSAMIIGP